MTADDHPDPVTTQDEGQDITLRFSDSTWRIAMPEQWRRVASDEDGLWCWELPGMAEARVRLRRAPRIQLEMDVVNRGDVVAALHGPRVHFTSEGTTVPWLAGSAGEVVTASAAGTVVWVQHRGSCVAEADGFTTFAEPILLRPAQAVSAVWRRHVLPPATIAAEPAWVPRQRYFPRDEALQVEHTDAAVTGTDLDISTTSEGSEVRGGVGLHELAFLDARGTALVEVGWYNPPGTLTADALALPQLDPNVVAWLLAATPGGVGDVDALDIALAEALERPSVWGVMAGVRAATLTDLPVGDDVRRAAQDVWRDTTDADARRLLATHALVSGWEPGLAAQWAISVGPATAPVLAQDMLASIGFGRITTSPLQHGGREVLLAHWWLAGHGESALTAEWEHAVDTARARMMCALSVAPDANDVAWLLAETILT